MLSVITSYSIHYTKLYEWACLLYSNIWLIAYGALTGEKLFYWLGVPLAAVSASGLVKYLISVIRGER